MKPLSSPVVSADTAAPSRSSGDAMTDMPMERRTIRITTAVRDGKTVEVAIRDTGLGISTQRAERMFEDFFTTKADGLGLGLPISRSIVEAHGGKLWLDTSVEDGACFRFSLPVSSAD